MMSVSLVKVPEWQPVTGRDAITREFKFQNFRQAFAFMTEAAMVAETIDHHPEWFNVYNKLTVTLTTHSAGTVTELDIKLATALDEVFLRFGNNSKS
jgi:4a-hydroxytetrahydrobiopterin dehydratase